MNKVIKPLIKKSEQNPEFYVCHDDYYIQGHGPTPQAAYADWKARESFRSRVPRKGVWNMQSCRSWWREGCRAIRVYVGPYPNVRAHIVDYDPRTDELILRGY